MLYRRIFCLWLVVQACGAQDAFDRLYCERPRRVTVCSERSPCPAARWRDYWLLARASSFKSLPYYPHLYAREGVDNCTYVRGVTRKYENTSIRNVVSYHMHPAYPDVDLMLFRINWPWDTELLDNRAFGDAVFDRLDSWIRAIGVIEAYRTTSNKYGMNLVQRRYLKMYSTPVKMFLVTVVLPSMSFIVFFLFIIFFTGKSKGNIIPYKNLNNGKKETTFV